MWAYGELGRRSVIKRKVGSQSEDNFLAASLVQASVTSKVNSQYRPRIKELGYDDEQIDIIQIVAAYFKKDLKEASRMMMDDFVIGILENPDYLGVETSKALLERFKASRGQDPEKPE